MFDSITLVQNYSVNIVSFYKIDCVYVRGVPLPSPPPGEVWVISGWTAETETIQTGRSQWLADPVAYVLLTSVLSLSHAYMHAHTHARTHTCMHARTHSHAHTHTHTVGKIAELMSVQCGTSFSQSALFLSFISDNEQTFCRQRISMWTGRYSQYMYSKTCWLWDARAVCTLTSQLYTNSST